MAKKVRKGNFRYFDDPTIYRYIDKATADGLGKWGAYVRRTARQSIKERPGPSKPGSPPHSHVGTLKKLIEFAFDTTTKTVVVGPEISTNPSGAPNILEFSGRIRKRNKKPVLKQKTFEIGDNGPIRFAIKDGKAVPVFAKIKTEPQARRATLNFAHMVQEREQENKRLETSKPFVAARPYMGPAMIKNIKFAPKHFKSVLKGK